MNLKQPFRIVVIKSAIARGRLYRGRGNAFRGAYSAIAMCDIAFVAWTNDTTAEPWREGFGTFLFAGIHAVRAEVIRQLADHRTRQIQIRTNKDRTVLVINRRGDGQATHYLAGDER